MEPIIAISKERGAVDMTREGNYGNISQQWSRPFNHVEADKPFRKLNESIEDAVEKVYERYAKKFLKYYRKRIKEHNTKNHEIRFFCGMGSCNIKIDGKYLHDFSFCHRPLVMRLLEEIEQSMDWSWATYLDGVILNEKEYPAL